MKNDTITISLDAERLRAMKRYMGKKDADLEQEMTEQLKKMYEKYVPVNVREYIDEKYEEENAVSVPKRPSKGSSTSVV